MKESINLAVHLRLRFTTGHLTNLHCHIFFQTFCKWNSIPANKNYQHVIQAIQGWARQYVTYILSFQIIYAGTAVMCILFIATLCLDYSKLYTVLLQYVCRQLWKKNPINLLSVHEPYQLQILIIIIDDTFMKFSCVQDWVVSKFHVKGFLVPSFCNFTIIFCRSCRMYF